MNVPGFIGDIFNGIDFQEFLDSLPQRFPVANFRQNALVAFYKPANRAARRFLYNIFYQNWVEETLFVDISTCPAVENEPECVVNSQGDPGQWTCRTPSLSLGLPNPFPSVATSNIVDTDSVDVAAGLPDPCTCPAIFANAERGPAFS
jgi:hypothetical protein